MELLAPAGDFEKLKTALHFGADAVYVGGDSFGLRKASKNFSREELKEAVDYCHERGKKLYVTMNIIAHDEDLVGLEEYARFLEEIQVDAVIVSDPGMFQIIQEETDLELHMSTQASITNAATINFWAKQGAKRIVLARELSYEEIKEIRKRIPKEVELEIFVHGAMCISYSGRCLLSNYMTGRDANQGDCAQACRWKYQLVEEKRPEQYYPVYEDDQGTYIFNSKDLCLLRELPLLRDLGIESFKIEGRVKTQYYVATVIRAYRIAMDALEDGSWSEELLDYLESEIKKASYRDFTKGFFYHKPDNTAQGYGSTKYIRKYDFIAEVLDYDPKEKKALIQMRNRFEVGDQLEVFGREKDYYSFTLEEIWDEKGESIPLVNVAMQKVWIPLDHPVEAGDMVRRKMKE